MEEMMKKMEKRDPSSHLDQNVKKYTYEGAAKYFKDDLNVQRARTKLGHEKLKNK